MGSDILNLELILPEDEQEKISDSEAIYDLLIVGGGSAGMTSAVYAARKQMKTLLISKDLGGQLLWTSDIENYMGYQYVTGKELTNKFKAQMQQFPIVDIITGQTVERVNQEDNLFVVFTEDDKKYMGKTIIIATGKRYRPLNVPGEKELIGKGVSYCATCDAPLYKGKNVAVIGGGNSSITSVIDLKDISNKIYVINVSNVWQADPVLIDRIKHAENFFPMLSHSVLAIHGKDSVTGITVQSIITSEQKILDIQGVFIEIGLLPNSELVRDIIPLTDLGEIMVDCGCKTSVPGLFGAGDVTTVPEKQIGVAIGEGIKATLSAYKYLLRMT